jgi:hypothetical protein
MENEDINGLNGRAGIHPTGNFFLQKRQVLEFLHAVYFGVDFPDDVNRPLPE